MAASNMKSAIIGMAVGAVGGYVSRYTSGLGVWSSPRLREYAYAVVEGKDEADAFARGQRGKGWPLCACLPKTLLFDRLFSRNKEGLMQQPAVSVWMSGFFAEQKGWERADDVGIVLRWSAATAKLHGPSNPDDLGLNDGIRGWRSKELEDLILSSLTEPDEPLTVVSAVSALGDDPGFTAVCTRAVAIMHLGEGPLDGKAGVLELPPKSGRFRRFLGIGLRRFLFFGMRTVT